jgi:hypothetical protein
MPVSSVAVAVLIEHVGYVGVLTGMRPGAFSLSIDERSTDSPEVPCQHHRHRHHNRQGLWANAFEALFEGAVPAAWAMRDALSTLDSFDQVRRRAFLRLPSFADH